jgi:hypothetical protein
MNRSVPGRKLGGPELSKSSLLGQSCILTQLQRSSQVAHDDFVGLLRQLRQEGPHGSQGSLVHVHRRAG